MSLHAKLAEIQQTLPIITKDKTAKVETRSGGSYAYKYADLADVTAAILPALAKAGLTWTCRPTLTTGDRFVMIYSLTDAESGDEIVGEYPLPDGGSPQQQGGWITYARRYALCAVVGLASDEDSDGQGEPDKPQRTRTKIPGPEHERLRHMDRDLPAADRGPVPPEQDPWADAPAGQLPVTVEAEDRPGTIDARQRTKIMKAFEGKGRGERLDTISKWIEHSVTSVNELSMREAGIVIAELEARR